MQAIPEIIRDNPDALMVIFFGGCGEFGMNLTCYYFQKTLIAVDCGSKFPPLWMLGVESIIPQVDTIIDQLGGIHSYLITHAHEDHIGGLPYFYRKWPAPIYATAWSISQIGERFRKTNISIDSGALIRVDPGDITYNDHIRIEWIPVDHSIPMSCALFISTSAGTVFHTGDFKFDPAAPSGIASMQRIGATKVDLLISDSTNANSDHKNHAEKTVGDTLFKLFESASGMIIVTSFSSNIKRIQQVIDASRALGKKVVVAGRGMLQALETAVEQQLLKLSADLLVDEKSCCHYPPNELVVLASGSQGERRSALYRIARDEHENIHLTSADTIIFSNRVIPGNELAVAGMINLFNKKGAKVITPQSSPGVAVSGHASRDDLVALIQILTPAFYIPCHGDFTQLRANGELLRPCEGPPPTLIQVENGSILTLLDTKVAHAHCFTTEQVFIDSSSGLPMSYDTLRPRLKIGELGLVVITGIFRGPDVPPEKDVYLDTFGLCFGSNAAAETVVKQNLTQKIRLLIFNFLRASPDTNETLLNEHIRSQSRQLLASILGKKPVVLSRIFLISQ